MFVSKSRIIINFRSNQKRKEKSKNKEDSELFQNWFIVKHLYWDLIKSQSLKNQTYFMHERISDDCHNENVVT